MPQKLNHRFALILKINGSSEDKSGKKNEDDKNKQAVDTRRTIASLSVAETSVSCPIKK